MCIISLPLKQRVDNLYINNIIMIKFNTDIKWLMKWLEKQGQEIVKNHKNQITCPECSNYLWDFSLKELNKNSKLHCKKCKKTVIFDLDQVNKKFK